ncbi:hypothetical protein [Comamonas sp. NLF-1-9]|uniref:hypothetical protein n=1 Tax=Comamonas sp. NLF-1-9 TaxID=2853163 RepID=UPI001C493B82|nr:hypothetical protein [Comamonas sp. NLF-1-9]QXL83266.1 hypothetical protein KUD94_08275 [Comamonas sp. NLF-1-9]
MFFLFNNLQAYKPNHREKLEKLEKLEKHQLARLCEGVGVCDEPEKPGKTEQDDGRSMGFSRFVTKGGCPQTRMKPCYSSFSSFSRWFRLRARVTARSARQRAQAIKRRRQIWEALHPGEEMGGTTCPTHQPADALGRKKSPQQTQSFAADTAAVSGESKRDINRHLARADALGDDLRRIAGTSLDKGVELDALAKLPEPERAALIERAQADGSFRGGGLAGNRDPGCALVGE